MLMFSFSFCPMCQVKFVDRYYLETLVCFGKSSQCKQFYWCVKTRALNSVRLNTSWMHQRGQDSWPGHEKTNAVKLKQQKCISVRFNMNEVSEWGVFLPILYNELSLILKVNVLKQCSHQCKMLGNIKAEWFELYWGWWWWWWWQLFDFYLQS